MTQTSLDSWILVWIAGLSLNYSIVYWNTQHQQRNNSYTGSHWECASWNMHIEGGIPVHHVQLCKSRQTAEMLSASDSS